MAARIDALGWSQDPTGAHQLRYHDGTSFTRYVCDDGVVGVHAAPGGLFPPEVTPVVGGALPPVWVNPYAVAAWTAPEFDPTSPPARGWAPPPESTGLPQSDAGVPQVGPPTPAGKARRGGLWLALAGAAVEAVAIAALSLVLVATHTTHVMHATTAEPIGSTVVPSGSFGEYVGNVVYSSNFGSSQGWDTGTLNSNTTAAISNGQYLVKGWMSVHHAFFAPYATAQPGMSVETSATDYPASNVSIGTGCQSASGISPALVYQLVVYPDGQWYIEEARIPGRIATLLSGQTAALGTAASTQLTCVITTTNSDAQTTQLVGYVNGVQVGAIGDQIDGVNITGFVPLLVLGSYGPRVSAAFTHITVRSIIPPQQPQLQMQLWSARSCCPFRAP